MSVSNKHILQQGPVLKALARTVLAVFLQKFTSRSKALLEIPSPEIRQTLPPRSMSLVQDYIQHLGGDPSYYKEELPPHLFPQWSLDLATRTSSKLPYPLTKVINGGCRLEMRQPLPMKEPLQLTARLVKLDDNGKRVVIHQKIVTGTSTHPDALTAYLYAVIPLKKKESDPAEKEVKKKEKPRVPADAKAIRSWELKADAGLDFAKLTGDFNPIHWIPSAAKAAGFKNTILQGFASLAHSMDALIQLAAKEGKKITAFDVQFTRPLVLPAKVVLYLHVDQQIYLGDSPGNEAYLVGTYAVE